MEAEGGISLKQVKLKVLYTFDADHKNNHLARWPHTLEVQSAQLDEVNVIGCIDLRICLQAIVTASPELTSNTESDFTIYAYDYSEPDTPLVGQGMLSKALSQGDNNELENEAMITGRVTKNVMGLFSKNAQETLEVKLRLTPVANSSFRRRSGSICSNPDTVQSHWNNFSQSHTPFRPSSPMDTSGLEAVQRMLNEGGMSRDRAGSFHGDMFQPQHTSRPTSRAGTPKPLQQVQPQVRPPGSQSRPSSRSGTRPSGHARRDSFNSGYYSGEDVVEEGPARKRARVQKVSHPSKSNLNIERQSDSLRVTASTASSVRLHRPVPVNPITAALQHNALADDPVRPPTPIPIATKTGRPRGRPRKVVSANLLRGPKPRASSPMKDSQMQESSFSSPEETRAESVTSTPADLPSSPPVIPETQNLVTSPQLPPLTNDADSGFMSGSLEDLFGDEANLFDINQFLHDRPDDSGMMTKDQPVEEFRNHRPMDGQNTMANLPSVFDENLDSELPSVEMEPPPPPPPQRFPSAPPVQTKSNSFASHHRPIVPAPRLAPALAPKLAYTLDDRRTQSVLPQVPASDPIGRNLQRSHTWAPEMSDAAMSDAVTSEEQASLKPKKRVGKEQTKARLENAIASGEMPPFCDNCGTIETPAWRRAYCKVFDCPWDDLETSLEPGECCYKEPIEHDAEGKIIKFKGYKSERRSEDKSNDGWTQICLCNPCGLWFHKSKFPRPPEKWQKRDPNQKKKRKRGPKPKKRTNAPRAAVKSDAPTPGSEDSSPADTSAEGGDMDDNIDGITINGDDANDGNEPELPPVPRVVRGGSAEPIARGLLFNGNRHARNHGRQVKSSPARPGNTRNAAIAIDLTPKPVARQLFPSPQSLKNKYQAAAAMAIAQETSQMPVFVRRSPRLNKVRDIFATPLEMTTFVGVGDLEKENVVPTTTFNDGLDILFDEAFAEPMPPPSTPKRRSERLLFRTPGKTPSRDFGDALSPNIHRTPSALRTPKNLHNTAPKTAGEIPKGTNSVEMTPFSRLIHDSFQGNNAGHMELPHSAQVSGSARSRRTTGRDVQDADFFDFPDLPSLKGSSPVGVDLMQAFDFSELTTVHQHTDFNDIFSTDMPMPSSPPQSYFVYEADRGLRGQHLWEDIISHDNTHTTSMAETDGVTTDSDSGVLRRSPRRHAA